MQGRAAITDGLGNFTIEPIEVGEPGADEVLVQVVAAGVCHTDWKSLRWGRRLILGHEGAGLVRQAGALVKHVTEGDRVLLTGPSRAGRAFNVRWATTRCASGTRRWPD